MKKPSSRPTRDGGGGAKSGSAEGGTKGGGAKGGGSEGGGAQGKKRWRGGNDGGGGLTTMRSDGVIVPAPAKGVKSVKNVKNALRSAQLDKAQLLMWRKFGYGEQLFAQYYGKQGLFPRDELPAVTGAFATPLPITFRLHATDPRAASLAARLRELADRRPNPLVRSLPWMPEGEGWQALLMDEAGGGSGEWGEVVKEGRGRGAAEHAADGSHTYIGRREKLHEEVAAVVREGTAAGLLARQEAVSMLPVLVLAPALPLRAGSRVLDVCAAPGNKTMQLLERCAPPPARGITGGGGGGIVVANDAHPGRVKTLHEAIARHCRRPGEMAALVITCALGQNIPVPTFEDGGGGSGCPRVVRGYDAVLTDVPCSGDGTLRKDPDVLRRWHPGGGNCLHATQLAVAQRAAALVRPGGALLYSTCSLNPVEDEAVVAGILTGPGGDEWEIEAGAVDRGAPGLKYRPGVAAWRVAEHVLRGSAPGGGNASGPAQLYADADDDSDSDSEREVSLRWYASYDEAAAAGMPAAAPTMWPPATPTGGRELHLERCARFLPHDQDTGGFFVALLRRRQAPQQQERVGENNGEGEKEGEQGDGEDADVPSAKRGRGEKQRARLKREEKAEKDKAAAAARAMGDLSDPVRPLPPGEASAIAAHLGLDAPARRRLWLGARGAVTLAPAAACGGDALMELGAIPVAAAGVMSLKARVLAWDEDTDAGGGFPYDFTQAGAEVIAPLARRRRVQVVPTDLQVMLAARASGVDAEVVGEGEVLCLTPDEMADATRRRWEQSRRGAAVFVLLKRSPAAVEASSPDTAVTTPHVAFAVAGRCSDDGFMLSPEVSTEEAKRLLARLSEVAGINRRHQEGTRRDAAGTEKGSAKETRRRRTKP